MKLPGFSWQDKIRPAKYSDIFLKFKEEPVVKSKPSINKIKEVSNKK